MSLVFGKFNPLEHLASPCHHFTSSCPGRCGRSAHFRSHALARGRHRRSAGIYDRHRPTQPGSANNSTRRRNQWRKRRATERQRVAAAQQSGGPSEQQGDGLPHQERIVHRQRERGVTSISAPLQVQRLKVRLVVLLDDGEEALAVRLRQRDVRWR